MQKLRIKNIVSTILVLLMVTAMLMTTSIQAQTENLVPHGGTSGNLTGGPLPAGVTPAVTIPAIARLSFGPNPVGVGQPITVNMWTSPAPGANRARTGYKVTITKPDGSTEVIGPLNSYIADGTSWFTYVPDQIGTWELKFDAPGDYYPAGTYFNGVWNTTGVAPAGNPFGGPSTYGSAYYQASSTTEQALIVQSDMVDSWPPAPLPIDYWTRPVIADYREWSAIMGDYPFYGPGGGPDWPTNTNPYSSATYSFVPFAQGPTSAHVAWRRQGIFSGLIGAGNGYESLGGIAGGIQTLPQPGLPSIIYNGRCYQSVTKPFSGVTQTVWQCYDLRTGQIYWELPAQTTTTLLFGIFAITTPIVPSYIEYAYGGAAIAGGGSQATTTADLLFIGGGRLIKFDPFTGAITANVSISPLTSGTYYMNQYCLSVQSVGTPTNPAYRLINWTTAGTSTNFTSRITGNVSFPFSNIGGFGGAVADYEAGVAALVTGITTSGAYTAINVQGASLATGALLFNTTVQNEWEYSGSCVVADQGKVAVLSSTGKWIAWDLRTGNVAWRGQEMDYPWGASAFGAYAVQSAYGKFYWESYDGIYAYNWADGMIAWHFHSPAAYPYDTNYYDNGTAQNPFDEGAIIADGIIYSYNNEHSAISPIARGWRMFAINATTGEGIWNLTTPGTCGPISDGYMVANSFYDGYLYVFGKGRSQTTISAPQTEITQGQSIVIQGSVIDLSPGDLGSYSNPTLRTDFPKTVPCVSKESMQTYMDYLYMQISIPFDYTVTGVPVSIDAVDPSNNVAHLGDTVTDGLSGTFGFVWKPDVVGKYTITATFKGDESYGSSSATTYTVVVEAPSTPATQPPQTAVDNTPLMLATAAIIIAIIIVGALIVLALRKR
jgi:hypothetical protein